MNILHVAMAQASTDQDKTSTMHKSCEVPQQNMLWFVHTEMQGQCTVLCFAVLDVIRRRHEHPVRQVQHTTLGVTGSFAGPGPVWPGPGPAQPGPGPRPDQPAGQPTNRPAGVA